MRNTEKECVWAGAAAGLAGGLAASFAMGFVYKTYAKASRSNIEQENGETTARAAAAVARAVAGRELSRQQKQAGGAAVHFTFGSSMGALYGAAAALEPSLAAGFGLSFGTAVWLGAHITAVPKLGLAESPLERPLADEAVELGAHLFYGAATDLVRRLVLRLLTR